MSTSRDNFGLVCLKGASQVFFMENAVTGALFFLAIAWSSFTSGNWATTIGAVLGVIVATGTARTLKADEQSYRSGLFGFNGILVGVALPTFIANSPELWIYIFVGAAVSTIVTSAFTATLTNSWSIPGSTGPFVLTAWLMLAGAYGFGSLHVVGEAPKLVTDYALGTVSLPAPLELGEIFFRNIGQVYLLGDWISGLIILIGIFVASRIAGVVAIGGSIIALLTVLVMRADPAVVSQGLYGFSPVLTAIALGTVFLRPNGNVFLYAAFATVATVFVQSAFDTIMAPTGLPSFTAPYVITLYLFIAPKSRATPHPHSPVAANFLMDDKS